MKKGYRLHKIIFLIGILFTSPFVQADEPKPDAKRWVKMNNIVKDMKQGIVWQDSKSTKTRKKTWHRGKRYCQNLTLSGARNWRLPTMNELLTIVDYTKHEPAINATFEFTNVMGYYWTSDAVITNDKYAWYVFFQYGLTYTYSKDESCYIRCVHDISPKTKG